MESTPTPQRQAPTPYEYGWDNMPQLAQEFENISRTQGSHEKMKVFLASKTIWGLILLVLGYGLQKLHAIDSAQYGDLYDQLSVLSAGVGTVLVTIGRLYATTKLTLNKSRRYRR